MKNGGYGGLFCLVLDFNGIASCFSSFRMILDVDFSYITFIMLKYVPSIHILLSTFFISGMKLTWSWWLILLMYVSIYFEVFTWVCFNSSSVFPCFDIGMIPALWEGVLESSFFYFFFVIVQEALTSDILWKYARILLLIYQGLDIC